MQNMYKRKMRWKSKLILGLSTVFVACIALLCVFSSTEKKSFAATTQAEMQVSDESVQYFNTYGIGETISIRQIEAQKDGEELEVFAYLQKNKQVVAELGPSDMNLNYVFEEKGKYQLIYFAKNEDLSNEVIRSYSFTVNKQPYFKTDFAPSYLVGSVINVDKKCLYDLESARALVTVTTPKGQTQNVSGSFCANEAGFYKVKFTSDIAGITFSRTYLLDVREKPSSYTEYFQSVSGVSEIRPDVSAPGYAKPGKGVAIYSNAQECVFQYGNIIDLNTLTKDDQLISMLPLVEEGVTPMSTFNVRLIDVYDPSNVIEYHVFSDYNAVLYDKEWTYASIIYKGKNYGIRPNGTKVTGRFGADMSVHIRADILESEHMNGAGYGKAEWFCAQTDYANKCFHVNAGLRYQTIKSHLLMDLSDSEHVGFGNEWSGFTTGEVYLQVKMVNSYGTCGMIVSEVAGEPMSGALSTGRMPAGFFLDSEEKNEIPDAIVGLDYRVPDVDYYVDALEGKVYAPDYSAKLYREILSPVLVEEIPMQSGTTSKYSFVPEEAGDYKLVYTVKDQAGNALSKDYRFSVGKKNPPRVDVDVPNELYVGEYFTIPKMDVENMSQLTYKKETVSYNGKDYAGRTGEVILLDKAAQIKIRAIYEDYLGQELKFEKIYDVVEKDAPIINIKGNVPKYVLKGQSIVLPDFSAIAYKNGAATVQDDSVRKITVDGQAVDLTARQITATKAHGETIKVVYSAKETSKQFEIKVIDAKYLSDRFYAASGRFTSVENNKNYVQVFFEEDVHADFINPIPLRANESFNVKFSIPEFHFDYVDVSFTDFVDSSKQVFIRLTKSRGVMYAQLNGSGSKVVLEPASADGLEYNIAYDSVFGAFAPLFTIDEYTSGYKFDFFPSSLLYLTFDVVGVNAPSSIRLLEIDGNKLASFYDSLGVVEEFQDYATPTLIREKSIYDLDLAHGTVVAVPKVQAISLYSGFTWAKLTVIAPSGKVLVSGVNAYNDNEIKLEEYGAYTLSYEIGYMLNSSQIITEMFSVHKNAPVEISFKSALASTVEVGKSITLPQLSITGMEENRETKMYLIAPDFTMKEVKENDKVSFDRQGIYRLVVVTSDVYNTRSEVFEILAERETK